MGRRSTLEKTQGNRDRALPKLAEGTLIRGLNIGERISRG